MSGVASRVLNRKSLMKMIIGTGASCQALPADVADGNSAARQYYPGGQQHCLASDSDLPSVQDVPYGRSKGGNLHHKVIKGSTQQEAQRHKRHSSVEVPESPSLYEHLNVLNA